MSAVRFHSQRVSPSKQPNARIRHHIRKMVNWAYFLRSDKATRLAVGVVQAFEEVHSSIASGTHTLPSNGVLAYVAAPFAELGFAVEAGKKHADKIRVPVL
ncbi:hypothetical protein [Caballeronia sp. GAFFF1]|uniref:hypothetical protein n=1 Tax=Caballeronia sp. GAFFF1 TaxID=2921779 RepID=UPI00202886ED|nr:hypothetical protein [Caballeronia sp. GAFFF1]